MSIYSNDGRKLGFSDDSLVEQVFEQVYRLTSENKYVSPDKVPVSAPLEESTFVRGETFMGAGWSNQFVAILNVAKKPLVMISPPLDGSGKGLYNKPAMFFSITSASSNVEQSAAFISYFINDIDANKVLLAERGVPIASKVRKGLEASVDEGTRATFDYINKINYVDKVVGSAVSPAPVASVQVSDLMKDLYDQVSFGKLSPHDAAAQFMKQANEYLEK
jgi:multiple sugar transport system substrate-binding protein